MNILTASMSAERPLPSRKPRRKTAQRPASSFENFEFAPDDGGPEMGWRMWLAIAVATAAVIVLASGWTP